MRVTIFITLYFYDSGGFAAQAAFIKVVLEMQDAVKNISLGVSVCLYENTEHRPTQSETSVLCLMCLFQV